IVSITMKSELNEKFLVNSPLFGANAAYIEAYYEQFLQDPESVDPAWRHYFQGLGPNGAAHEVPHGPIKQSFVDIGGGHVNRAVGKGAQSTRKQAGVLRLINY